MSDQSDTRRAWRVLDFAKAHGISRAQAYVLMADGRLDYIQRHPARYVRGNVLQTLEYTLVLRCRFKLTNKSTGLVIDERTVNGTTSFYATGSDSVSQDVNQDERQAIPLAAEDMAVQLVTSASWVLPVHI